MVAISQAGNVTVIEPLQKTLDARTNKQFREAIQSTLENDRYLVLDLSALTFIDSSGLGALLACVRQIASSGGTLKLCSLNQNVRAVFQLVRMHRLFDIYNTREEAIQAFKSSQ